MNKPIPSLLSLMEKQFAGTHLSPNEHELARLCWLGGAWALFQKLAEAQRTGDSLAVQKAYAEELRAFVKEVIGRQFASSDFPFLSGPSPLS